MKRCYHLAASLFRASVPVILALLLFGVSSDTVRSHSGGTNAAGCHTNRKTGDFHCHTAKVAPSDRALYCHRLDGGSHCGYALRTCSDLVRAFGGSCVRQ